MSKASFHFCSPDLICLFLAVTNYWNRKVRRCSYRVRRKTDASSSGVSTQRNHFLNGGEDHRSSPQSTPMKQLADYCKRYSVTVDIVMSINDQSNIRPEKRYITRVAVCRRNNLCLIGNSHYAQVYFGLNKTVIATAHGSTVSEAKSKAADRAMTVLLEQAMNIKVSSSNSWSLTETYCVDQSRITGVLLNVRSALSIGDRLRQVPLRWEHVANFSHSEKSSLCCIYRQEKFVWIADGFHAFMDYGVGRSDRGKVVAFGVGSRCSSPDTIDEDGGALLDCHALALARRALLRYDHLVQSSIRQRQGEERQSSFVRSDTSIRNFIH